MWKGSDDDDDDEDSEDGGGGGGGVDDDQVAVDEFSPDESDSGGFETASGSDLDVLGHDDDFDLRDREIDAGDIPDSDAIDKAAEGAVDGDMSFSAGSADVSVSLSSNLPEWVDSSFADDDRTPDAPDGANIDRAVEFDPLGDVEEYTGRNTDLGANMIVGRTDDGGSMYITREDAPNGLPMKGTAIAAQTAAAMESSDIPADAMPNIPDMYVDEERGAAVLENADGEGSTPAFAYEDPDAVDFDADSYAAAAAYNLLVGGNDLEGNIVAGDDGQCYPIDFDWVGSGLQSMADADSGQSRPDDFWDDIEDRMDEGVTNLGVDVSVDDVQEKMVEIASATDLDILEANLDGSEHIRMGTRDKVVENFRLAREGKERLKQL